MRFSIGIILFTTALLCLPLPVHPITYESSNHTVAQDIIYSTDIASEVYHAADINLYRGYLQELTANGSRGYGSAQNEHARNWLIEKFDELTGGKAVVTVEGHYDNIIARLPGTLGDSAPSLVVGAHYDTVNCDGANDDGSGTVALLELARILSPHTFPLDIYLCAWNAEEFGLYGSAETAPSFIENEIDILAYYNIDMLLYANPALPSDELVYMFYTNAGTSIYQDAQLWAEQAEAMNQNFGTRIIQSEPQTLCPYWRQSDHYPFYTEGYKSVIFTTESGLAADTFLHTEEDTWDNPEYDYMPAIETVASLGASIAFGAQRPQNQLIHEKYSMTLDASENKSLLVCITKETPFEAVANMSVNQEYQIQLRNPDGGLVYDSTKTLGSTIQETIVSTDVTELGQYELIIINKGASTATVEVDITHDFDYEGNGVSDSTESWVNGFDADSDNDLISDSWEEIMGTQRFNADEDNDGLSDYEEIYIYKTSPSSNDTDRDLMSDSYEVLNGLQPKRDDAEEDLDGDGLTNLEEFLLGTKANSTDSDSDGMPDSWEVYYGTDPCVDDARLDPDGDLLVNIDEYRSGTNPFVADSITLMIVLVGTIMIVPVAILYILKRKNIIS
ncbi:MAG: M28 family peptidase [Candidatus Lokiarchaeota archaeon]|nr:M28 family peptidase [Candidatus Lokiarchaeota archaeon]